MSFLTSITVDGIALWVVILMCFGIFLASFMDAIAGGGGVKVASELLFPEFWA